MRVETVTILLILVGGGSDTLLIRHPQEASVSTISFRGSRSAATASSRTTCETSSERLSSTTTWLPTFRTKSPPNGYEDCDLRNNAQADSMLTKAVPGVQNPENGSRHGAGNREDIFQANHRVL